MTLKDGVKFGWKSGHGAHTEFGKDRERRCVTEEQRTNREHFPQSIICVPACIGEIDGSHPTQKPVALMEYLIRTYSNPGETVLDNTFGSCTTGVACVNTGRSFIGIERDESYFAIAEARIAAAQAHAAELLPFS